MSYLSVVNLAKEPFSNTPDPEFFFPSRAHLECLQKIELSIRLRRGLCVIVGEVGTGKTTICRRLIRDLASDKKIETHLVLDPGFVTTAEFLSNIYEFFNGQPPDKGASDQQLKEAIKKALFRRGVEEERSVVFVIDEGQKLTPSGIEILRELLNYETNEFKLLQIIIFTQKEFEPTLRKYKNFSDRISLYYRLGPLSFKETRDMIQFRLEQAKATAQPVKLFTPSALRAIYNETKGYPRRIINLCHAAILKGIIQNKTRLDRRLVFSALKDLPGSRVHAWRRYAVASLLSILILVVVVFALIPGSTVLKDEIPGLYILRNALAQLSNNKELQSPDPASAVKTLVRPENQTPNTPLKETLNKSGITPPLVQPPIVNTDKLPDDKLKTKEAEFDEKPKPGAIAPKGQEKDRLLVNAIGPPFEQKIMTTNVSTNLPGTEDRVPIRGAEAPVLGRVTVQRGDSLSLLAAKIYGNYHPEMLDVLLRTNPMIIDPSIIHVGEVIAFPEIQTQAPDPPLNRWWLVVARPETLEEAIGLVRNYPEDAPRIRLIPYRSESAASPKFIVVLATSFDSKETALEELHKLPSSYRTSASLFSQWNKDWIFSSNPYR